MFVEFSPLRFFSATVIRADDSSMPVIFEKGYLERVIKTPPFPDPKSITASPGVIFRVSRTVSRW
jgi:hypothetical protein